MNPSMNPLEVCFLPAHQEDSFSGTLRIACLPANRLRRLLQIAWRTHDIQEPAGSGPAVGG